MFMTNIVKNKEIKFIIVSFSLEKNKKHSTKYDEDVRLLEDNFYRTSWLSNVIKEETKIVTLFDNLVSSNTFRSISRIRKNKLIGETLSRVSDEDLRTLISRNEINQLKTLSTKDDFIREPGTKVHVIIDNMDSTYYGHICYRDDEDYVTIDVIKMSVVNIIKRKLGEGASGIVQVMIAGMIEEIIGVRSGICVHSPPDPIVHILERLGFSNIMGNYILNTPRDLLESNTYILDRY